MACNDFLETKKKVRFKLHEIRKLIFSDVAELKIKVWGTYKGNTISVLQFILIRIRMDP